MSNMEIRYGDVFLDGNHICDGNGILAIGYGLISDIYLLVSFGNFDKVSKKVAQYQNNMEGEYHVIGLPVHEETVKFINEVRGNNGKLAKINDFLEEFARNNPDIKYSPELDCFMKG